MGLNITKRKNRASLVFLLLSLGIHGFILAIVPFLSRSSSREKAERKLEVVLVSPEPQRPSPKSSTGMVVEQDQKAVNDEVPEETKFLSRHNQRVLKETRAARSGTFNNQLGKGGKGQEATQSPALDWKALQPDFFVRMPPQEPTTTAGQEASQTNDHLKGVEVGLQTLLSSREFVYYAYYERIRSQLRQHWEPSIRERVRRLFAEGRNLASDRDHVTRLLITLDRAGALKKVSVLTESGTRDLDEAAIDAFRAAEPFPNPPRGMIESDGTVKIRWDFILEA